MAGRREARAVSTFSLLQLVKRVNPVNLSLSSGGVSKRESWSGNAAAVREQEAGHHCEWTAFIAHFGGKIRINFVSELASLYCSPKLPL